MLRSIHGILYERFRSINTSTRADGNERKKAERDVDAPSRQGQALDMPPDEKKFTVFSTSQTFKNANIHFLNRIGFFQQIKIFPFPSTLFFLRLLLLHPSSSILVIIAFLLFSYGFIVSGALSHSFSRPVLFFGCISLSLSLSLSLSMSLMMRVAPSFVAVLENTPLPQFPSPQQHRRTIGRTTNAYMAYHACYAREA